MGSKVDARPCLVDIRLHMAPSDILKRHAASMIREGEPASGYTLIVVGPEDSGRTFHLDDGRHLLGRSDEAQIRFTLETISRRHALFIVDGEHVTITDLDSRVGTFVNGRRVTSCALPPGARIVVGGLTLKLVKV